MSEQSAAGLSAPAILEPRSHFVTLAASVGLRWPPLALVVAPPYREAPSQAEHPRHLLLLLPSSPSHSVASSASSALVSLGASTAASLRPPRPGPHPLHPTSVDLRLAIVPRGLELTSLSWPVTGMATFGSSFGGVARGRRVSGGAHLAGSGAATQARWERLFPSALEGANGKAIRLTWRHRGDGRTLGRRDEPALRCWRSKPSRATMPISKQARSVEYDPAGHSRAGARGTQTIKRAAMRHLNRGLEEMDEECQFHRKPAGSECQAGSEMPP